MATSLLRIGRLGSLKALQLESWGVLRRPAAALCTQGGANPPANQAKAPSKTVEAPDERASLLAYKTTVAFPVRPEPAGFSPAHPLGEPQPEAIPVAQTAVAAAAAATLGPPATTAIEASPAGHVDTITKTPPPVAEAAHPVYTDPAPQVAVEAPPSLPESVVTDAPVVAKTTDDVTPAAAASSPPEGPSADGSSSSSSSSSSNDESDSDSDSDSDSEDEVKTKTKESTTTAPSAGEVGVSQDSVTPGDDVKDQTADAEQETPAIETIPMETPPTSDTKTTEVAEVTVDTAAAAVTGEELVDSAPEISSAAEEPVADAAPQAQEPAAELPSDPQLTPDTPVETSPPPSSSSSLETLSEGPAVVPEAAAEAHVEPETQAPLEAAEALPEASPVEAVAEAPIEAVEAEPEADAVEVPHAEEATPAVEAEAPVAEESPESVSEVAPAEVAPEAAVKTEAPVEGAEELVDSAPVLTEAAGEELQAEGPAEPEAVEASEEAAAAAPEPEEPFDNSTYKNCQHHDYNTFTFVDLDLEMAKHRLPQPSSGRPSPQH